MESIVAERLNNLRPAGQRPVHALASPLVGHGGGGGAGELWARGSRQTRDGFAWPPADPDPVASQPQRINPSLLGLVRAGPAKTRKSVGQSRGALVGANPNNVVAAAAARPTPHRADPNPARSSGPIYNGPLFESHALAAPHSSMLRHRGATEEVTLNGVEVGSPMLGSSDYESKRTEGSRWNGLRGLWGKRSISENNKSGPLEERLGEYAAQVAAEEEEEEARDFLRNYADLLEAEREQATSGGGVSNNPTRSAASLGPSVGGARAKPTATTTTTTTTRGANEARPAAGDNLIREN